MDENISQLHSNIEHLIHVFQNQTTSTTLTYNDENVVCLCHLIESLFLSGLKVTSNEGDVCASFWPLLEPHLTAEVRSRLLSLKNITTNIGLCRAWLRSSLNNSTLEDYLRSILGNDTALKDFYQESSVLMKPDVVDDVIHLASVVSRFTFQLDPNSPDLNTAPVPLIVTSPPSTFFTGERRRSATMDDAGLSTNVTSSPRDVTSRLSTSPPRASCSLPEPGVRDHQGYMDDGAGKDNKFIDPRLRAVRLEQDFLLNNDLNASSRPVLGRPCSLTSMCSSTDGTGSDLMDGVGMAESMLRSLTGQDHNLLMGYGTDAGERESRRMGFIDLEEEEGSRSRSGTGTTDGEEEGLVMRVELEEDIKSYTMEEMRVVVMDAMECKMALLTENRHLRSQLDSSHDRLSGSQKEVEEMRKAFSLRHEADNTTILGLRREADLLKHQLKKYIAIVQNQKRLTSTLPPSSPPPSPSMPSSSRSSHPFPFTNHDALSDTAPSNRISPLAKENPHTLETAKPPTPLPEQHSNALDTPPVTKETSTSISSAHKHRITSLEEEIRVYELRMMELSTLHGELLEVNERMHKEIVSKDNRIQTLHQQIVEIRGPLADCTFSCPTSNLQHVLNSSRKFSINSPSQLTESTDISVSNPTNHSPSSPTSPALSVTQLLSTPSIRHNRTSLDSRLANMGANESAVTIGRMSDENEVIDRVSVNLWIPCAFMRGEGKVAHHVYQIYVRVGRDEWNVYRRYSDFYALHAHLRRFVSWANRLDFPSKRLVGRRADGVVEDRRRRLQTFLRHVVKLVVQDRELEGNSDQDAGIGAPKRTFIRWIPFLADGPISETSTRTESISRPYNGL